MENLLLKHRKRSLVILLTNVRDEDNDDRRPHRSNQVVVCTDSIARISLFARVYTYFVALLFLLSSFFVLFKVEEKQQ